MIVAAEIFCIAVIVLALAYANWELRQARRTIERLNRVYLRPYDRASAEIWAELEEWHEVNRGR